MSKTTRLLKNTFYLMIADALKPIVSFFFIVYISRTLGTGGIGEYGVVLAFLSLFEILAQLGISDLIVREVATKEARARRYLGAAIYIGAVATVIVIALMFIALYFMQYPDSTDSAIKILSISLIFFVVNEQILAIFVAFQRMEFRSLINIIDVFGRVLLGITALQLGYGVIGLIVAIVIVRIATCILSLFITIHLGAKPDWRPGWPVCKKLLRLSPAFLLLFIVAQIYWTIDVIMLSKMQGMEEVGIYNVAHRIMDILKTFSVSYVLAFFPMIAQSYIASRETFQKDCAVSLKYLFIFTFPAAIGISILADKIILLFFGKEFINSGLVLVILIWTICLLPFAMIFGRALVASHNQNIDLFCNIVGMIINVILNYLLIPWYSYIGAAIATLCSIFILLITQYVFIVNKLGTISFLSTLLRPALAGIGMGLLTFVLYEQHLFFSITLSAILYFILLFLLNTFSASEIQEFKSIWHSIKTRAARQPSA